MLALCQKFGLTARSASLSLAKQTSAAHVSTSSMRIILNYPPDGVSQGADDGVMELEIVEDHSQEGLPLQSSKQALCSLLITFAAATALLYIYGVIWACYRLSRWQMHLSLGATSGYGLSRSHGPRGQGSAVGPRSRVPARGRLE